MCSFNAKNVLGKGGLALLFVAFVFVAIGLTSTAAVAAGGRPVVVIQIDGPISPASDDFLKTSVERAKSENARLLIVELNTPGGMLTSMQSMVETILESPVPIVVYVSPSGGGAISAGVFITMAGHFAVMAPGTTIGAAHPVTGTGDDVSGDMRAKVENFAVSHIRAIAEQRGRNAEWAEKAVRESVAITDREALEKKVVDFIASDIDRLLLEIEGKTVQVDGQPVTLTGVAVAPRIVVEPSFKQIILGILADPNITILLGLAAMLGIGIELYHPGAVLPGLIGVICLVLSLTSAQVLPINYGGLALVMLSAAFFVVEGFLPSFGIWGGAGIVCLVLGSIYLIDTDMIWSTGGFGVKTGLIGSVAGFVGAVLLGAGYLVLRASKRSFSTGQAGLIGQVGQVLEPFGNEVEGLPRIGRVRVMGELWKASVVESENVGMEAGQEVEVVSLERGMQLHVRPVGTGE